jgi:hypothetical protein
VIQHPHPGNRAGVESLHGLAAFHARLHIQRSLTMSWYWNTRKRRTSSASK